MPAPNAAAGSVDIFVRWGDSRVIPAKPAPGQVLAQHEIGSQGYAVTASEHHYTIRFFSECEFVCHRNLGAITVHPGRASAELAGLFLVGSVLSTLLTLQGRCIVHASAVSFEGMNLAFIGPSGQGKSTLAAALCLTGAQLISDDALRCDSVGTRVVCYAGAQMLRLRAGARPLLEGITAQQLPLTVDGRLAFAPPVVEAMAQPLHALIIPSCSNEIHEPSLTQLSGAAALTQLAASARVVWWQSPDMRRTQFELMAALAHQLPVFSLSTPRRAIFEAKGRADVVKLLAELKPYSLR